MTGIKNLYLGNNQFTGVFQLCFVYHEYHSFLCCDLSTGVSSGVRVLRSVCMSRRHLDGVVGHDRHADLEIEPQPVGRCVSVVWCVSHQFLVVICRPGRVLLCLPGAPCGDDGVLFVYVFVAQAP